MDSPKTIEISEASGQAKVIYNNRKATHNHKSGKRRTRPKNAPKSANDWNRLFRRAMDTASNNFFADNLINTWYITLTIKDPHIKNINTVRKWIKEYEKSFSNKVFILANIELNKVHHPHVHLLLTTPKRSQEELIPESEIKNWPYGFVKATRPPMKYKNKPTQYHFEYIRRLINYSIKTWSSGTSITINNDAIKKYDLITTRLKKHLKYLNRKSINSNNNKVGEQQRKTYSLYHKANAKLKENYKNKFVLATNPSILVTVNKRLLKLTILLRKN